MTWFKVDDNLPFHAKVVAAGNPAMGLWVRAGAWSAQQLTDGFIPDHMILTLGTKQQAERLVLNGLWVRTEGGYRFHEWAERQPSKVSVTAERDAAKERMRLAREGRKQVKSQVSASRSPELQEHFGRTSGEVRLTRPDPTRPVVPTELPTTLAPRKRGTRIPDDFPLTPAMRAWAQANTPRITNDLDSATAEFVDYWQSLAGAKATKLDWTATWRVRMRQVDERRGQVRALRPESPRAHRMDLPESWR